jgi:resuscitation-promoting factor RpfA
VPDQPVPDHPVQEPDDRELDDLIRVVDLDGLIGLIDGRCTDGDWAGLLRLRDRCTAATVETGRQLWPAATLAEYRLALLAPDEWAATVLDGESGRFTIGPLSEVIAVGHTWAGLFEHLEPVPIAMFVAHERAIRGEAIPQVELATLPPVLDIPAALQPWEPTYPVSVYTSAGAEHPEPPSSGEFVDVTTPPEPTIVDDDSTALAVRQLLEAWTSASTGRAESVCVEGDRLDALAALGVRSARIAAIPATEAIARLAWAGASGGAQGRRRGMAIGRFSAWWLLGALGDLHDDWPPTIGDVEELLANLRWYRWDAHEPAGGWRLQLVVEDVEEGLAWAINASDHD